ncbi:MAG: glycosyltransferase [Lachnospiraceae bacterium]|nr:glycosyltransferase [Lachnospiraceae bacterium]
MQERNVALHILYYKRTSIMNDGVERAFERLGFTVDPVSCMRSGSEWDENSELAQALDERVAAGPWDVAFSLNFNPQISAFCEQHGIPYIAWMNDSPLYIRDEDAMRRSCNHLFTFDRGYVADYLDRGMPFSHMPLAVDTDFFEHAVNTAKPAEAAGYRTDVAMVGSLYSTDYAQITAPLSPQVTELLEQMLKLQQKVSDRSIFPELLTDALLARMNGEYAEKGIDFTVDGPGLEFLMLSEVTGRDRKLIPALLAKQCEVRVYSKDTLPLPGVLMKSPVDYRTQMPLVFRHSRININATLRAIRTGIPLRVLDVLGCGGFLITNAQEEILEHFDEDRELAVYRSIEELPDKVDWYLRHDTERQKIAAAGCARVKRDFTFEGQLKKMFAEIQGD